MSDRTWCSTCERWVGDGIGHNTDDHPNAADMLAEATGEPREKFDASEYEVPDPDELESVSVDE